MWWKKFRPRVKNTEETREIVVQYLLKEYRARLASPNPDSRQSAGMIQRAATDFLIDIDKTEAAIKVLKGLRKEARQVLPGLDISAGANAFVTIGEIEIFLKKLGVTDFEA